MLFKKKTRKVKKYFQRRNDKINNYITLLKKKNSITRKKKTLTPTKQFSNTKIFSKNILAGKPIASGGFGCVFKPPLNCKKNKTNNKYVSKLMLKKYADEEMKLINTVKKELLAIPYYSDYFMLRGIYSCPISKLSNKDKAGFNKKCSVLTKKNIVSENINSNLSKLRVINIPYGGIDLDVYWDHWLNIGQTLRKKRAFGVTNLCLVILLSRGIVRMNKIGFYHLDIKGSNILRKSKNENILDTTDVKTRLIDWGLSMKYKDNGSIPIEITDRPFQFNLPFSSILFNSDIQDIIDNYVKEIGHTGSNNDSNNDSNSVINKGLSYVIFDNSVKYLGEGHLGYMISFIDRIYKPLYKSTKTVGRQIICEYIQAVLNGFLETNFKLNLHKYLNEVFLKNVDIWGFIVSYNDLITKENPWKDKFECNIVKILTEYCFGKKYATEYIPISKLINDLLKLNISLGEPIHYKNYPKISNK